MLATHPSKLSRSQRVQNGRSPSGCLSKQKAFPVLLEQCVSFGSPGVKTQAAESVAIKAPWRIDLVGMAASFQHGLVDRNEGCADDETRDTDSQRSICPC